MVEVVVLLGVFGSASKTFRLTITADSLECAPRFRSHLDEVGRSAATASTLRQTLLDTARRNGRIRLPRRALTTGGELKRACSGRQHSETLHSTGFAPGFEAAL